MYTAQHDDKNVNSLGNSLSKHVETYLSLPNDWSGRTPAAFKLTGIIDRIGQVAIRGDADALYDLHHALFILNEKEVAAPRPFMETHQFDPDVLCIRDRLEHWADSYERMRLPSNIPEGLTPDETLKEIVRIWKTHDSIDHPIFDYVQTTAGYNAVCEYLRSDYLLNIRFYDLVVYSLIGIDERVRFEVAHNLWDEVGQGNPANTHVQLYRDLLQSEGITPCKDTLVKHLSWQGLAGYNLMMRHGLHRKRYFESLGSLAVTELADPDQYKKFVLGCKRVGIGAKNAAGLGYYEEHISVDVLHGEGWLENVIKPQLVSFPEASRLVLSGVYQRLNTAKDYWDELLTRMKSIDETERVAQRGIAA